MTTRQQLAVVRALADELHRYATSDDSLATALRAQLVHELGRLGFVSVEAAEAVVVADVAN